MTVSPKDRAYSIARRITREFITGWPSSEMAIAPASFIAPISASCSPALSFVMAPIGKTFTRALRRARSTMKLVTVALSFTGIVFGMQHTEVKPPAAAAREPVSIVSACSMPGSRRWTCMSMKPGATISPPASRISAPAGSMRGATAAIRLSSINTSAMASWLEAGSITLPPRISKRGIFPFLCGAPGWKRPCQLSIGRKSSAARESSISQLSRRHLFQHRHADRHAVLHLVQNHGARRIGHFGSNLAAPVDRSRVHHQYIRLRQPHVLQPQAVKLKIFALRERRFMLALQLYAQHHDHVGAGDRLLDARRESDSGGELHQFRRQQGRRPAQHDIHAEFREQMNI